LWRTPSSPNQRSVRPWTERAAYVLAAATLVAVIAVGSTGQSSLGAVRALPNGDWTLPNANRSSTRTAEASPITAHNVGTLHVLWRFALPRADIESARSSPETLRGVVSTPIVARNTVYVQDATSSVYAVNRATGKLRWEHRFRADNYGRNGVTYSSGSIYGSTDTTVFALSAATGRLLWQRRLVTNFEQFVDIAPTTANNVVYTSTVGYPPGGRGALYALDAHTGAILWKFVTIRGPWRHPNIAGGGGAWYTPSIDLAGNVYSGVANPYPIGGTRALPNGGAFPGPALYTDSLVVLNGKTGHLLWYDQVTPHDVRDYDFQLPPILATIPGSTGQEAAVFGAGKAGIVIGWDEATHRRLWETRVGKHLNDLGPLPARKVTVCPGFYGGVESPMAYAGGELFVPVVDLCSHGSAASYQAIGALDPVAGTGEFVALDARSGRTTWTRKLPQPDFGCATVASGVVFTSTFDGELYGLAAADGRTLWRERLATGVNGCPSLSGKLLIVPAGSATTNMPRPRQYALVAYAVSGVNP